MRVSERKVRALAKGLAKTLNEHEGCDLKGAIEGLELEIAAAIHRELKVEEDLDREVEETLRSLGSQLSDPSVDTELLRRKIKQQLAKQKGIVL
ncbi:MAG: DUF507 family protein [Candidatus Eisenbacteria bacterium]|uniref:DUF507 family protein n=1 Tax=Eiseniibacteriota bacterium TaxID=2212470 RepID=A0A7Y2EBW8_UNCEI|nr:DUF507 family protein [Candidatus Eisenbacteria bacterium]